MRWGSQSRAEVGAGEMDSVLGAEDTVIGARGGAGLLHSTTQNTNLQIQAQAGLHTHPGAAARDLITQVWEEVEALPVDTAQDPTIQVHEQVASLPEVTDQDLGMSKGKDVASVSGANVISIYSLSFLLCLPTRG